MNPAPEPLPNDIAARRAMLVVACSERDAERAEKAPLAAQNDHLRHLIRQLQRRQFGRRSEKLAPDQRTLALEDVEQAIAETEQEKADPAFKRARAETRRAGRGALPEHLPRVEIVIEPETIACQCCGGAMQVIGDDRSHRLDVIPAQYRVLITRRPKYACRTCQEGVVRAAAPARLIAGGLPTERLVASGGSPATTGRGAAGRHRRWFTATPRAAAANMRSRCSRASPACCRPMPMPPTANSPIASGSAAR